VDSREWAKFIIVLKENASVWFCHSHDSSDLQTLQTERGGSVLPLLKVAGSNLWPYLLTGFVVFRIPSKKFCDTALYKSQPFPSTSFPIHSRHSSVSVTTRLRDGRPGFDSSQRKESFSLIHRSAPFPPTQPPIQWVPGALTPGVKRPECETEH
jgi:hypothetical protein